MAATPIILPPADLTGFDYKELSGSPSFTVEDGFKGRRQIHCPWADRFTLAAAFKGTVSNSGGNTVIRLPQSYPGFSQAFVGAVQCDPFTDRITANNGDPKNGTYERAILDIAYATSKFNLDGGNGEAMVTETLEGAAEFLTLSHEKLYWDAAHTQPLAETEAPQFILKMVDWVYTIHQVDYIPAATFTLMGCVNQNAIFSKSLKVTFAAETLLYQPPRVFREMSSTGQLVQSLEYHFINRPWSWNKVFKKGGFVPQPIYDASGAVVKQYPPADFTSLIG